MMPMRNSPLGQGQSQLNPFGSAFAMTAAPGLPPPAPMPGGPAGPMGDPMQQGGVIEPNSSIPGAPVGQVSPDAIARRLGMMGAQSPSQAPDAFPPNGPDQGSLRSSSRLLQRLRG